MSMNDRTGPQPIARILQDVLKRYGLQERLSERSALLRWPEVVGTEIAEHSRAVDIQDGVLTIEADHGVWRHELTLLMPLIVEKFNQMCGQQTVTEIRWRHGPASVRRRGR